MSKFIDIKNATVLVQTSNHTSPHLETEMEIVERLLEQNNTVYWIKCEGDFQNCYYNPLHKKMHCKVCHSRVSQGIKMVKKQGENSGNLHVLEYKQFADVEDFKKKKLFDDLKFDSVKELKAYHYKDYDLGLATVSSLVSYIRDHEPDLTRYENFVQRGLVTGAYLYDVFTQVVEQVKPDLVVFFNGRFIENRPLLRVCQKMKIDYATHEKGGKLNTYLFRLNSIPHSIETISEEMEELWQNGAENKQEIGTNFFTNKIKGVEDAWFSFTKEQQEGRLPASFKELNGKKVITIFNSSLDEYEGLEGFGPYFYHNDNEGIKRICEDLQKFPDIKLYLRVHPNLRNMDNTQIRFLNDEIATIPSVEIIAAEDKVDTYALINSSDIIIVFGSTVGVEAAFANKKVVLLGKAAYENLNCFVTPKDHDDLLKILTDNDYVFPEINPIEPIKYGHWNETFGLDYHYYKALGFNKGIYRGKAVKGNFFLRKIKRMFKF
ncbi:capsular polysaccharide export protein, LipB/KpsS family [Flavobacterium pedocola]